ncbi:MAG: VOC family protein [Firmicutes bacterium]|nr:VOC family protein [Bacillota bacterium]
MALINKIHHVAMRAPEGEGYEKALNFYTKVLGLEVLRSWPAGCMIKAGEAVIELFNGGEAITGVKGTYQHLALGTDDIEACVKAVNEAGYPVFDGPRSVVIKSDPPFPIRCAFVKGPLGEEIEFFQEL